MVDRRDLLIRLANEDQTQQFITATYEYEPWVQAHGQSFEQYRDRIELEFREGAWIQNGRGLTWVLVHRSDYDGEVLAACETHRTRAMVKRQGEEAVEPAWFYGVSYVIAPKKHRGKK